jgi:hypothetical protein
MDYDEIAPKLQTGDLILFEGTSLIGRIIDLITHSKFCHIGMVVRQAGPGAPPDDLYLWQSFEPQNGVVLDPLKGFLTTFIAGEPGGGYSVRQLDVARTPAMLAAVDQYMGQAKGKPFPTFAQWIIGWIAGNLGIPTPETNFFCSELVAQTYMAMGLLPPRPLATAYSPARFSAEYPKLPLQLGASLGPEIPITLSAPASTLAPA